MALFDGLILVSNSSASLVQENGQGQGLRLALLIHADYYRAVRGEVQADDVGDLWFLFRVGAELEARSVQELTTCPIVCASHRKPTSNTQH
jgi:hypothetical protein